jgi:hypothetical protein
VVHPPNRSSILDAGALLPQSAFEGQSPGQNPTEFLRLFQGINWPALT